MPGPGRPGPRRFVPDDRGTTAIEFGLLVLPLMMFVFGIVNSGYYFFTLHFLDRGVEEAGRRVRTGEAQKLATNVGQFRNLVCNAANGLTSKSNAGYGPPPPGGIIECAKLTVLMQSAASWADLTAQSCLTSGAQSASTGQATDPLTGSVGAQDRVVLVTACYTWELPKYLPFLKLGNRPDGSVLFSSSTAFRTEAYQ
jgi:Flp pilus assembly protein TadG